MSAAAILTLGPALIDLVRRFVPDRDKAAQAESELSVILSKGADRIGEAMVEDAKSSSRFQSGWRPMIGWTCAVGIAVQFVALPVLNAALAVAELSPVSVTMDTESLIAMTLTLLGVGTLRTYERIKGKA